MFAPLPLPLAPSNDFLNAGVFANVGLPTPAAFLASGLAAQSALGPPTVPSASAALGMLPTRLGAATMGGFDEFSDQGGDDQITLISVPMRVRSFAGQPWHRTIAKGTHLFNSLVPATALDDKYTLVSPPVLNLLHQQAAYAEARIAAGESHDMSSGDYATLRRLTARTPSEFAEMWGYAGVAVEPSQGNEYASEPQWAVSAPGGGRVEMANIFGPAVKTGDVLSFVVRLETLNASDVTNPHAPQPINVLRVRGFASSGPLPRITTKTGPPRASDVDCVQRAVRLPTVWRKTKYDDSRPVGQKFVSEVADLGALVSSTLVIDLYEHGFVVRVGYASDPRPMNADPAQIEAAHVHVETYKRLPLIGVTPLVDRR